MPPPPDRVRCVWHRAASPGDTLSPFHRPFALRSALIWLAAVVCLVMLGVATAGGEPAQVQSKRAQVEALQAELAEIDAQVGDAAEAYNGARYRLSGIEDRIRSNIRLTAVTEKNLASSREALAERLRRIYVTPDPSLARILLESDSLSSALEEMDLLNQVSRQDSGVVERIAEARDLLRKARVELNADRKGVQREVADAKAQKAKVEQLLNQRRSVLLRAEGELGRLLEAEKERERQEAARQNRIALARQAAASAPASAAAASPGGAVAPPALPSGSGNAAAAQLALQYLGVPYRWGGASPSTGFDCSGLASYVYAQIGKSVPHYTVAIYNQFPQVPADQLQAGDMVFFRGLGHMGIYLGGGQMVHAPRTGDVVKVSSMGERSDFVGAVRP